MANKPKQPQDHLPPKAAATDPPKPAGWELLKPFDQVPVWEQTDLIALVQPLIPDSTDEAEVELDLKSIDLSIIGELAKRLQDYAVDKDAYIRFVSGPGALDRAIDLGMAYAIQLGESGRSASS